jgi:pimeloyl-ACP methyl ester carboxylesterase
MDREGNAAIYVREMTNRDHPRPPDRADAFAPGPGSLRPNERIVQANGVNLCVETFGDPADPGILLIAGAAASMDWWEDGFCQRLAAGPRFVIRYDNRDTGRSVSHEPGAPPHTQSDLVADAVGLLDTLGV